MFAVAAAAHALTVKIWPDALFHQIDLEVYRDAVRAPSLYGSGVTGELKFVYPPFAALLFSPFAALSMDALRIVWTLVNAALLIAVVRWCLLRLRGTAPLPALALLTGVVFWLDPVRVTFYLGQVNLVLLALVVWDLLRNDGKRWQGVGVGIAAAIKLTPLLFVVYLLLTRRFRAAGVALGAFAACVGLGFALRPSDSARFWFAGTFFDIGRINPVDSTGNHSLRGLTARLLGDGLLGKGLWVAGCLVVLVALVAVVRRGHEVQAVALCGMAGAAVSPYSWTHHWVWLVPFVVYCSHMVLVRGDRIAWASGALAVLVPFGFLTTWPDPASGLIPSSSLASLESARLLVGNIYVLLFAVLVVLALKVRDKEAVPAVVLRHGQQVRVRGLPSP
ncbi:glycosyltransferase 87 family protein [Actinokineospora guangxiensis]|uniref:Glycosyltransferase 87 family protein n=1 Tax=Actinokineospora guangxiensis TaxID=1490288 RepID=A0ABW0ETH6_9PSEU